MPKPSKQKVRKSVKLKAADRTKITNGIATAEAVYASLAEAWPGLSPNMRERALERCPLLSRILAFADRFSGRW